MKKVNLHIPEPCHEDWDQMTPAERGRFCAKCEKIVTDYTQWSTAQITEALRQGQLGCGRFRADQLEQTYVLSPANQQWRRAATLLFPLLLGGAGLAGQTTTPTETITIEQSLEQSSISPASNSQPQVTVHGRVSDEMGEALIGVYILIKGTQVCTVTDIDGFYSIKGPTLEFSYTGYSTIEKNISSNIAELNITLQIDGEILGEYIVIGYAGRTNLAGVIRSWWQSRAWLRAERKEARAARRADRSAPTPVTPTNWDQMTKEPTEVQPATATAPFSQLRVSPNPFRDQLNIQFTIEQREMIQVQLLNSQGQVVSHRSFETQVGFNQINWTINAGNLAEGLYFLQLIDADGQQQTESLLHANR